MSLPARYLPPVNRCLTHLDKQLFLKKIPLVVVSFPDPRNISVFTSRFKEDILRIPRICHVVPLESTTAITAAQEPPLKKKTLANDNHIRKGILLKDSVHKVEDVKTELSQEAQDFLQETKASIENFNYTIDYDFYKAEEIFNAILPEHLLHEVPSGFTVTGHIAHLNLRAEFKPLGEIIGQVILDKNSQIKTVVDKVDSIANKFRTFQMKLLAGEEDFNVTIHESNCTFNFDFRNVYWNSRLHTEHNRLVTLFKPHQLVCDVFAGVGPFALPAAKKQVFVLANDLNPHSYESMINNIKTNKVGSFVNPSNLDGREFIAQSPMLLESWLEQTNGKVIIPGGKKYKLAADGTTVRTPPKNITLPRFVHHYVMNLPDSAITFLNEFVGLYSRHGYSKSTLEERYPDFELPWIHCHCFLKYSPEERPEPSIEEQHNRVYRQVLDVMEATEKELPRDAFQFHLVRKVAPTKPMFCVSFRLPASIAFKEKTN
ncbi:HBR343Wp [Eremothecium sinecaudum]|uniref:tRNA (guanine(37)-N1)-methyltransferase n=1 Tax=Eremothecium sinecaudum TaxID=45286 RepID=A0A120K1C5_9SACH|nr:HBR343Wp [Eremothecium sinecaudum]AMD19244.1 HBR343Wp [Eremothecium sinecaudum]